tara:strand:- start:45 stop:650 length:606 start_codon:yes stop_codon:yes gene_type:complete
MKQKILAQGAEALISLNSENQVLKSRVSKGYRLPILDKKMRKSRTKKEAKILTKALPLIPVPKLIKSDPFSLEMEFIEGEKLSDSLPNASNICETIGKQIAILHNNDIVHGDLTTSNMILSSKDNKLYFIDFGLSFISKKPEDFAVDLHLIKQALEAKHFKHFDSFFSSVLNGYTSENQDSSKVLKRLEKVESRGRYKQQY